MSKAAKIILLIDALAVIVIIAIFFVIFNNMNANKELSEQFENAATITDLNTSNENLIGTSEYGYLQPSVQFQLISDENGQAVYQFNKQYVIFTNLNKQNQTTMNIQSEPIYRDVFEAIKDLPEDFNEKSKIFLNNCYNRSYLIEKLYNNDVKTVIITETDQDYFHELFGNMQIEYNPAYLLTSDNKLVTVIAEKDVANNYLGTYVAQAN